MSIPKGTAAYKKKDGILTLTSDQKTVIWTPKSAPDGPPTVSLAITNITNLQQTPDSSAKVMLKIFEKAATEGADPVSYLFHFNSNADPRAEAKAVKELLSRLVTDSRSNDPSVPRPSAAAAAATGSNGGGGSGSAAMTFASAANSKPAAARFFHDNQLKNDIVLQQSLMKADRTLHQMYMEGRTTKPETMSDATFNTQFWSTRINLLRAHAIEVNQKKGPYNVLAQVKPTTDPSENNRMKLSITVEQVQMIFNQHPLVKRIYNENVPPLAESEFWERFFLSRLAKKLRGEHATVENADKVFDKYDEYEDITAFSSRLLTQYVPHIIDVEGNEENQGGFKSGNLKDIEMRPRGRNDVPIIQTLNSMSQKLLTNVNPMDNEPRDSNGSEGNVYSQLALRDLRGDVEEHRIMLNIKEQSTFFSNRNKAKPAATDIYVKQKPAQVLEHVQRDLESLQDGGGGGIDLHAALGVDEDSDSEDEGGKGPHVGSQSSRTGAQNQILDGVKQRRAHLYGHNSDETTPMGLPEEIAAKCNLTHATTMEFLHQFWDAFLSGDPDRAAELGYLVESLKRSKERIKAVADEADKVRMQQVERRKQEIINHFNRTGKKIKGFKPSSVPGGRDPVEMLMKPVMYALDKAMNEYQRAVASEGIQVSSEI